MLEGSIQALQAMSCGTTSDLPKIRYSYSGKALQVRLLPEDPPIPGTAAGIHPTRWITVIHINLKQTTSFLPGTIDANTGPRSCAQIHTGIIVGMAEISRLRPPPYSSTASADSVWRLITL